MRIDWAVVGALAVGSVSALIASFALVRAIGG